ncbi:MAG: hypothetical protein LC799_00315 [Actinobacteria bacterium]|nr:hypothetical protein [Actinomycetota bacterium]
MSNRVAAGEGSLRRLRPAFGISSQTGNGASQQVRPHRWHQEAIHTVSHRIGHAAYRRKQKA